MRPMSASSRTAGRGCSARPICLRLLATFWAWTVDLDWARSDNGSGQAGACGKGRESPRTKPVTHSPRNRRNPAAAAFFQSGLMADLARATGGDRAICPCYARPDRPGSRVVTIPLRTSYSDTILLLRPDDRDWLVFWNSLSRFGRGARVQGYGDPDGPQLRRHRPPGRAGPCRGPAVARRPARAAPRPAAAHGRGAAGLAAARPARRLRRRPGRLPPGRR